MEFATAHPKVRLRIQPMVNLFDLEGEGIDIAVRWGKDDWSDMKIEPLFEWLAEAGLQQFAHQGSLTSRARMFASMLC